jgi:glycerol-3-phosphate dehydrogenase
LGLASETVDHILRLFGSECAAVFNLAQERRELMRPLTAGHPAIEAEVIQAARRELAQRVEDVLVRRLHLFYEAPEHGLGAAQRTAVLLAEELGWDADRTRQEVEEYAAMVSRENPIRAATP